MQSKQTNFEKIYEYLKLKYKRITIGKKELANELGISLSTLDLYMAKKSGIPRYQKLGNQSNSRVVFNIVDVAEFLSSNYVEVL